LAQERAGAAPGTLELNWNMSDDDARAITAFLMQQKAASKEGASK